MDLTLRTFHDLAAIIRHESGIVLGPDKTYLVRHRLEPLVRAQDLDGFDTLVRRLHLRTGTPLRNSVIDAVTVKETRFFRDKACFDGLIKFILPAIAGNEPIKTRGSQRVRIWSAAAATGQEAYSLAMLVREFTAGAPDAVDEKHFTILTSDISAAAIAFGKAACFTPAEIGRGVSDERLRRHFERHGKTWRVNESVRRMVQFRTFNLLHSPASLGTFDLILCRNVLIYFDESTRREICQRLYTALQPGGWLVLGSAESLYGMENRFEMHLHARSIFYRKPTD